MPQHEKMFELTPEGRAIIIQGHAIFTPEGRAAWIHRASYEQWTLENGPLVLRSDRAMVMTAVRLNGMALKFADSALQDDYEIVSVAVSQEPAALQFASDSMRNDLRIVLKTLKRSGSYTYLVGSELCDDLAAMNECLKVEPCILKYASSRLRSIPQFVETAVRLHPECLVCAPEGYVVHDRNTLLQAISKYGSSIRFGSEELRSDRSLMVKAMEQDATAYIYGTKSILDDRELALRAVAKSESVYELLKGHEFHDDYEIARTWLSNHPRPVYDLAEEFRGNRLLILDTLTSMPRYNSVGYTGTLLRFVSTQLRDDFEVVYACVAQHGYALYSASQRLKANHEIALLALKDDAMNFELLPKSLLDDRAFVLAAVSTNGIVLEFLDLNYKSDEAIVTAALGCPNRRYYVGHDSSDMRREYEAVGPRSLLRHCCIRRIRNDPAVYRKELEYDASGLAHLECETIHGLWQSDPDVLLRMITDCPSNLEILSRAGIRHFDDRDNVITAVQTNGTLLEFVRSDVDVCLAAAKQTTDAFEHVPHEHRCNVAFMLSVCVDNRDAWMFAEDYLVLDHAFLHHAMMHAHWSTIRLLILARRDPSNVVSMLPDDTFDLVLLPMLYDGYLADSWQNHDHMNGFAPTSLGSHSDTESEYESASESESE